MRSSPPSPTITSARGVPNSLSSPFEPTIVAGLPKQPGVFATAAEGRANSATAIGKTTPTTRAVFDGLRLPSDEAVFRTSVHSSEPSRP
jgi:hypothetical protein